MFIRRGYTREVVMRIVVGDLNFNKIQIDMQSNIQEL